MQTTKKQDEALALLEHNTNILLYGGARSGKTFVVLYYLVYLSFVYPGSWHLVARRYAVDVKAAIWADTLPKVLKGFGLVNGIHYTAKEQLMEVMFHGKAEGSRIICAGLDDNARVEKVLGREYASRYINEAHEVPFSTADMIDGRLSQKIEGYTNQSITDLNPPGTAHWTYKQWFKLIHPLTMEPLEYPEKYAKLQMNPYDNQENLPPEYIETRLKTKVGDARLRFFEGEYQDITELRVFVPRGAYKWEEFATWVNGRWRDVRLVGGLDLGYQDADAFAIIAYIDGLQETWVLHEHKGRRQSLDELAQAIKKGIKSVLDALPLLTNTSLTIWSDTNTIHAGLEGDVKKNWRMLRDIYGFDTREARKAGKALSIELLREDVNTGRMHVPAGGVFADESDQTVWTKNKLTGDIERIIDDEAYHPDFIHAVRYAFNFLTSPAGNSAMVGRELPPAEIIPDPAPIRQLQDMAEQQAHLDKTAQMWEDMTKPPDDY